MPYKDKSKAKEAMKRYRMRKKGITDNGANVIPKPANVIPKPACTRRIVGELTKLRQTSQKGFNA